MTKAKKVLSFCLAVVMVIGMFAFGAFAAGENATISVTVDQASVKTGDIVNVTVKLTTDYFVGPLQLPIHYDPAVLQYVDSSANPADVFGANGATKTVVSQTNNGCVQFGFVPVTDKGAVSQKLTDYQIVTFQLKAVADGSSEVALHAADQKSPTNTGGLLYVGSFSSSSVDETANPIGQALTLNGTTVTVGGTTAVPELQLSETGKMNGVVIDKVSLCNGGNGFVYGINTDTGSLIEDQLTTPAGSIRVTANDQGVMSTGAKIELLNDSGVVVETYIFVFFGDVNGDSLVEATDLSLLDGIANYLDFTYAPSDGTAEAIAMDINGDDLIEATDLSIVDGVANYIDFSTQADFAAVVAASKGIIL